MSKPSPSEPSFLKRSIALLLDFFVHSENKVKMRIMLVGAVLAVLAASALAFALGWWCLPFIYSVFIAKSFTLVFLGLGAGALLAAGIAGFNYLANHLKSLVFIDWRSWLTKKMTAEYLGKKKYLDISRIYKDIDNPDQRIQEDIDIVVDSALNLSLGFIDNFSNLTIYMVLLCIAGSSFSLFLGPAYLVVIALGAGVVSSLIGYFISKALTKVTNDETVKKSNLRGTLQQVKNAAEEVAIEQAEDYYQNRINNEIDELNEVSSNRLEIQNRSTAFNVFNGIIQIIIPFIAALPLYFYDLMTIDVFYSVGYYFSMVTRSLTWFIESFETINIFRTSLGRIDALNTALNRKEDSTPQIMSVIAPDDIAVEVRDVALHLHDSEQVLIKGFNLQFKPHVHTLIKAPSGTGKSSLFKAIAGTWVSGEGEIVIPKSRESLYFLPQRPTLPADTLRNVLVYPDAHCSFSDEELKAALCAVKLDAFIDQLDQHIGFKSLGEQQRIAFARVLLRKPDWVFLDEVTSSLDEDLEDHVYSTLKKLLPNTTIISIAHRSTVKHHHNEVMFFSYNDEKSISATRVNNTM